MLSTILLFHKIHYFYLNFKNLRKYFNLKAVIKVAMSKLNLISNSALQSFPNELFAEAWF